MQLCSSFNGLVGFHSTGDELLQYGDVGAVVHRRTGDTRFDDNPDCFLFLVSEDTQNPIVI